MICLCSARKEKVVFSASAWREPSCLLYSSFGGCRQAAGFLPAAAVGRRTGLEASYLGFWGTEQAWSNSPQCPWPLPEKKQLWTRSHGSLWSQKSYGLASALVVPALVEAPVYDFLLDLNEGEVLWLLYKEEEG